MFCIFSSEPDFNLKRYFTYICRYKDIFVKWQAFWTYKKKIKKALHKHMLVQGEMVVLMMLQQHNFAHSCSSWSNKAIKGTNVFILKRPEAAFYCFWKATNWVEGLQEWCDHRKPGLYRLLWQPRHRIRSPSGKKPAPTRETEHWEQVKHGWCHWRSSNEMYFPPPKPGRRRRNRKKPLLWYFVPSHLQCRNVLK